MGPDGEPGTYSDGYFFGTQEALILNAEEYDAGFDYGCDCATGLSCDSAPSVCLPS
jgi:hypothetical protein